MDGWRFEVCPAVLRHVTMSQLISSIIILCGIAEACIFKKRHEQHFPPIQHEFTYAMNNASDMRPNIMC